MLLKEILDKPISLRGTVAYEEPYRIDGVCGLNGEIEYSVVNCQVYNEDDFHTSSLLEAIKYVNEKLTGE